MQYSGFLAFFVLLLCGAVRAETTVLAGISYDATAPLRANLTQRKDTQGKPLSLYALSFLGGGTATVTALVSLPASPPSGKLPAVILLHGLGGDKTQLQALALLLNGRGYATVSIDAAGHGERPKLNNRPVGEQDLSGMRTLAAQTVQDLRRTVDYLASRSDIDVQRIAFVGVSLGGVLGARFLADEPRVATAALWVAGGDWGTLITTSAHAFAKRFRESGETDAAKIRAVMAEVDPVPALHLAAPRPLLFLNGATDDIVPKACSDALFAAARAPKERAILPGGHVPNLLDMAGRTLTFLEKTLRKPAPAPSPKLCAKAYSARNR